MPIIIYCSCINALYTLKYHAILKTYCFYTTIIDRDTHT